ncbi:hypothetical protein DCMF_21585 [Candidatus Formimonas warabiya]|uniref:Methyl-accepting chemotaxis protein n=2 Tax=Formimonas warabiya TaxID=1761012 RepID=A0A3G1L1Y4_FORW1|nr:hypothetical protein DCMF_21585 [Candidatus Formimonas warabiya]
MTDLKIKTKLLCWVGLMVCFAFVVTIYFVASKSSRMAEESAQEIASEMANYYASYVHDEVDTGMTIARTLAQTFFTLKVSGKADRDALNQILKDAAEKNPQYIAVWTCWEPDALDGKDRMFVDKPGHDSTGRFISYWKKDGTVEPLALYETPGAGDYYLLSKESHKETVLEPYLYTTGGKQVLITSLVVPILEQDRFLGVVGIDIGLDSFQKVISGIKPFQTGSCTLISHNGLYVAYTDEKQLGKDIGSTPEKIQWKKNIKEGKGFSTTSTDTNVYRVFVPVDIGNVGTPWSLSINIPWDKIVASANEIRQFAMIIAAISLAIVLGVLYLVAHRIVKPIEKTTDLLKDIAEGNGDLTKRLTIGSKDEIGLMSRYVNQFVENTQHIIKNIAETAESLAASTQEMSAGTQQMSSGAQAQASQVQTVHYSIDQMVSGITDAAGKLHSAAQTAHETNNKALNGAEKVQLVTAGMKKIHDTVEKVSNNSEKIGAILDVIDDIADQTNLLALNAAIEAARAGEQGRGFAVVAEEVRKLAERSGGATKEISQLVNTIRQDNERAVEAVAEGMKVTAETGRAFDEIRTFAGQTNLMIDEIVQTSEQAAQTGQEVAQTAQEIAAVTQENAAGVEELAASSEEIAARAEELGALVRRFKTV